MDRVRYVAGLLVLLTVPLALGYWFLIHPFIRFWRRLGPAISYTVLTTLMVGVLVAGWRLRGELLGGDLGLNRLLFGLGMICVVFAAVIGQEMRKQFTVAKLLGVQEIKGDSGPQELVTTGIYSRIRHPRYASVVLGLIGFSLIANIVGAYLAVVVFIPGLYAIVLLEERELKQRFGDAYRDYCQRVPRFIPRLRK